MVFIHLHILFLDCVFLESLVVALLHPLRCRTILGIKRMLKKLFLGRILLRYGFFPEVCWKVTWTLSGY